MTFPYKCVNILFGCERQDDDTDLLRAPPKSEMNASVVLIALPSRYKTSIAVGDAKIRWHHI